MSKFDSPSSTHAPISPEVVRGIQHGLIQEDIRANEDTLGGRYQAEVRPDAGRGSREVSLILCPAPRQISVQQILCVTTANIPWRNYHSFDRCPKGLLCTRLDWLGGWRW